MNWDGGMANHNTILLTWPSKLHEINFGFNQCTPSKIRFLITVSCKNQCNVTRHSFLSNYNKLSFLYRMMKIMEIWVTAIRMYQTNWSKIILMSWQERENQIGQRERGGGEREKGERERRERERDGPSCTRLIRFALTITFTVYSTYIAVAYIDLSFILWLKINPQSHYLYTSNIIYIELSGRSPEFQCIFSRLYMTLIRCLCIWDLFINYCFLRWRACVSSNWFRNSIYRHSSNIEKK